MKLVTTEKLLGNLKDKGNTSTVFPYYLENRYLRNIKVYNYFTFKNLRVCILKNITKILL